MYLPHSKMQNILYPQVCSLTYWFSLLACVGLILPFEAILKHYSLLKDLEKKVRVSFVEKEIELSLLHRSPGGGDFE